MLGAIPFWLNVLELTRSGFSFEKILSSRKLVVGDLQSFFKYDDLNTEHARVIRNITVSIKLFQRICGIYITSIAKGTYHTFISDVATAEKISVTIKLTEYKLTLLSECFVHEITKCFRQERGKR